MRSSAHDSSSDPQQILLIDDNPLQLRVRETVLRSAGFQVSIATTVESALATLRILGHRVGLIITDHVMPERSGSEFVRQLRDEMAWVPVIVLSGMPEAISEYEGLDVVFRQKPMPPPELIELVRSTLSQGRDCRGVA